MFFIRKEQDLMELKFYFDDFDTIAEFYLCISTPKGLTERLREYFVA